VVATGQAVAHAIVRAASRLVSMPVAGGSLAYREEIWQSNPVLVAK